MSLAPYDSAMSDARSLCSSWPFCYIIASVIVLTLLHILCYVLFNTQLLMCGLVAVTRTIVSHSYYCGLSLILYKPAPEHLYCKPPLIRAAGYRQLRRRSVYCRPTRLRLGLGSMFSSQKARRVVKNERVGPIYIYMSLTPTEKPSVINQWLSSCQWICAQRYALISVHSSWLSIAILR